VFKYRLISFIILLVFLFSLFWESKISCVIFGILTLLFSFAAVNEYYNLLSKINRDSFKLLSSCCGAAIVLLPFLFKNIPAMSVLGIITVLFSCVILFSEKSAKLFDKALNSISGILLIAVPLSFLPAIYMGHRKEALLYMILVTKAGDTGAYITGMLSNKIMKNGNHKIVPSVSPKKSWEGTIGGLFSSIIVSLALGSLILCEINAILLVISGAILFFGGFAGDLFESVLKRMCGAKDSGNVIPGMGGVLDVLDSLMLNAPLFYVFMNLI